MTNFAIAVQVFLQIALVLFACRLVGAVARRFGQPQVVGEMIAGVALGPSLLGGLFPELYAAAFPAATRPVIYSIAQVGVAFYMFVVGMEFQVDLVRRRIRSALAVSFAGILAPFVLGGLLGLWYVDHAQIFVEAADPWEAALYLGAAMSITAFPMLARIIYERGLTGSPIGALTLAAGSIDDVSAWCILAVVLASFSNSPSIAAWAIGGGLAYFVLVWVVVRPALRRLPGWTRGQPPSGRLAWVLMLAALACWYTDWIGIYAVFGGFVLGAAMPRGEFTEEIRRNTEPVITALLLPFFFVWSGLNTELSLVVERGAWMVAGLILLAAIVGKGVACGLAARWCGESPRDAIAIGALMNSRGLMELIIANIGLERGLITPTLYTMLVIMAIVTTLLATPVFEFALGRRRANIAPVEA